MASEVKKGRIRIEAIPVKKAEKKKEHKVITKKETIKKEEQKPEIKVEAKKESTNLEQGFTKRESSKETEKGAIYIHTTADKMFKLVQDKKMSISELVKELNISAEQIEEWGVDMQEEGLVIVEYPTNVLQSPRIEAVKKISEEKFEYSTGKVVKSYDIIADEVPTKIRILDVGRNILTYEAILPIISYATEAIMNQLKAKISEEVSVTSEELVDPRSMELLKEKFLAKTIEKVKLKFPNTDDKTRKIIAGVLLHKMYGLKDLELLMNDDYLEEISINGSDNPIAVYHKEVGWCITNIKPNDEEEILNFSTSIARKVGKNISLMNPLMDAHLISGDRVQSTLFPISSNGNTITIRKFARNPWTITQQIKNGTLNVEIGALLWLAVQYELSVMIAGGTASGKTSALNSLTALIPSNQRVISIEDIREIKLPEQLNWNWVPLTVREARTEGHGNISMIDLMVTSLRMRPDRIIVGEVRTKRQAEVLFEAIHTGHSVYTTLHADNAEQAYIRMIEAPISIPVSQLEGLHLIVIMFRDRRSGVRKLLQVAEIMPIPGDVGERTIKINLLYRWTPKNDKWEKLDDSERVINDIAMHTGMTEEEINKDLKEKEEVLTWMVKKEVLNINAFGKVIDEYYRDPKRVIGLARKNDSPGVLL